MSTLIHSLLGANNSNQRNTLCRKEFKDVEGKIKSNWDDSEVVDKRVADEALSFVPISSQCAGDQL